MKDFFKSGKNIAILVLAIVLAGSVACNICLATRRCAPRGPRGNGKQIEQFQGGQQGQMPAPQGDNNQAQPPQGQPPQAPANGQQPNAQSSQDGQNMQKNDSNKKGNNDDKKDSEDDDDDDEKTKTQ